MLTSFCCGQLSKDFSAEKPCVLYFSYSESVSLIYLLSDCKESVLCVFKCQLCDDLLEKFFVIPGYLSAVSSLIFVDQLSFCRSEFVSTRPR